MTGPRTPAQWRELLACGEGLPEDVPAPGHRERRRRSAVQCAAQARAREPRGGGLLAPGVAAATLVLVAGAAAWVHSDQRPAQHPQAVRPAAPAPAPEPRRTTPPTPDASDPDVVAAGFGRAWETRTPPRDQDIGDVAARAATWTSPALAANLAGSPDPAWERMIADGGVQTVTGITVHPAEPGLPADNPLRVWRTVWAAVRVDNGGPPKARRLTVPVEVVMNGARWQVSRVLETR